LKKLDFMPYKFRKSLAFDDENVRDFIFKGYVIPYKIDKEKDLIIILGIYKENLPNF
ncbi:type II toxin-antitoxin system RelE/ParE family toxin, partial [Campylobacter jejuni]|nr:type II toxin-antitoxin system RelE/ParE family toxin [Campylobacter jejuni]